MEFSDTLCALFIGSFNLISGLMEYFVLKSIYDQKIPALLAPKASGKSDLKLLDLDAMKKYRQNFFLPGLSFGLVYLTVLGFDSVTTGYIAEQGTSRFTSL